MIGSFIGLIMLLGLGLSALLGALAAHRGFVNKGTWTLLISSILYLLILVGLTGASFFAYSGGQLYELLSKILAFLWFASLLGISTGAFLITSQWRKLSSETNGLEKLALQLAAEREEIENVRLPH